MFGMLGIDWMSGGIAFEFLGVLPIFEFSLILSGLFAKSCLL